GDPESDAADVPKRDPEERQQLDADQGAREMLTGSEHPHQAEKAGKGEEVRGQASPELRERSPALQRFVGARSRVGLVGPHRVVAPQLHDVDEAKVGLTSETTALDAGVDDLVLQHSV